MPFHVKVEIKDTGLYGLGVFALEDIPTGTKIWSLSNDAKDTIAPEGHTPETNRVWSESALRALETDEIKRILWGGYLHTPTGLFVELRDGEQFKNHSDEPNQGRHPSGLWFEDPEVEVCIAIRPISKGEQITEHYGTYHDSKADWVWDMMCTYCPGRRAFEAGEVKILEGTLGVVEAEGPTS